MSQKQDQETGMTSTALDLLEKVSLPALRKGNLGPESRQSTWQHTHENPALTSPLPEQWAACC